MNTWQHREVIEYHREPNPSKPWENLVHIHSFRVSFSKAIADCAWRSKQPNVRRVWIESTRGKR